jgi:hypothetical protein
MCDDEDGCTQGSSCQAGECVGLDPVQCPQEDGCYEAGICDATTGECTQAKKTDDGGCDDDTDGVVNADDKCPQVDDPEQTDTDGDELGDACDPDDDDDGASDEDELAAGTDPLDPNEAPDTSGEGGSSGAMASGGAASGGTPPTAGSGSDGDASGGAKTTGGSGGRPGVGAGAQPQTPSQAEPEPEPGDEGGTSAWYSLVSRS